jgi:hypothetical protein
MQIKKLLVITTCTPNYISRSLNHLNMILYIINKITFPTEVTPTTILEGILIYGGTDLFLESIRRKP